MASVHHVVLFKLKPEIDMMKVRSLVDACLKAVPGLIELHLGAEQPAVYTGKLNRAAGFTHILISRHINGEALQTYATHPEHLKLAKYLGSFATSPAVAGDIYSSSKL